MFVTFGEVLFRFGTPGPMLLSQASSLDFYLGGTELNVAMALSAQGFPARWVSCLPDRDVGDLALEKIRRYQVDTQYVRRAAGRMGYYLMETGAAPRPARVLERQKSVLAEREDLDFDWPTILQDATWFHTTGITVGLSQQCNESITTAMQTAAARKIPISYDFNYRRTIWPNLEDARARQRPLLKYVNVLFCSAADFPTMFDTELPPPDDNDYFPAIQRVLKSYEIETAILSERGDDHNNPTYRIAIVHASGGVRSPVHALQIVDRIGAGDAMTAGYIRARLDGNDWQATADFAGFCGALKHTIPGDFLPLSRAEIDQLYQQQGGGLKR